MSDAASHFQSLLERGDLAGARAFASTLFIDPRVDRGRLHAFLGVSAAQLGDYGAARAHLELALELGVADARTLGYLGELVRPSDAARGRALLERAAALCDPPSWLALALARCCADDGDELARALPWLTLAASDPACSDEALTLALRSAGRPHARVTPGALHATLPAGWALERAPDGTPITWVVMPAPDDATARAQALAQTARRADALRELGARTRLGLPRPLLGPCTGGGLIALALAPPPGDVRALRGLDDATALGAGLRALHATPIDGVAMDDAISVSTLLRAFARLVGLADFAPFTALVARAEALEGALEPGPPTLLHGNPTSAAARWRGDVVCGWSELENACRGDARRDLAALLVELEAPLGDALVAGYGATSDLAAHVELARLARRIDPPAPGAERS